MLSDPFDSIPDLYAPGTNALDLAMKLPTNFAALQQQQIKNKYLPQQLDLANQQAQQDINKSQLFNNYFGKKTQSDIDLQSATGQSLLQNALAATKQADVKVQNSDISLAKMGAMADALNVKRPVGMPRPLNLINQPYPGSYGSNAENNSNINSTPNQNNNSNTGYLAGVNLPAITGRNATILNSPNGLTMNNLMNSYQDHNTSNVPQSGMTSSSGQNGSMQAGALSAGMTPVNNPQTAQQSQASSPGNAKSPENTAVNAMVNYNNQVKEAREHLKIISLYGDPSQIAAATELMKSVQEGNSQVKNIKEIDGKQLDAYAGPSIAASEMLPLIKQYREIENRLPPGAFTPGVRNASLISLPDFTALTNLSHQIAARSASMSGLPAGALRSNAELGLINSAAASPNQFYSSLNNNLDTLQQVAQRAIFNKNDVQNRYQDPTKATTVGWNPYTGPTTIDINGNVIKAKSDTPLNNLDYTHSNKTDAIKYMKSLPPNQQKAWLAEFKNRHGASQ